MRGTIRLALIFAALAVGASSAAAATADTGTISICNAAGNPPVATILTFSIVAPASAGGTQVATLSPGACSARYFLPVGLQITLIENVPTGDVVTNIAVSGAATLDQTSLAGGVATVTVGNSDSIVTFTTRGAGAPPASPCVVPRVIGLTLAAARTAIRASACRVRSVSYVSSKRIPKGGVTSVNPRSGAHLAHNAGVRLYVSRGR